MHRPYFKVRGRSLCKDPSVAASSAVGEVPVQSLQLEKRGKLSSGGGSDQQAQRDESAPIATGDGAVPVTARAKTCCERFPDMHLQHVSRSWHGAAHWAWLAGVLSHH